MSLSLYESSVPVYERGLNAFLAILDKAEEHATARKFDPNSYLAMRLSPDMWPLARQVQAFCDCPSSDELRHIAGFQKGGSGSSVIEIMRHAVDAASDGLRLSGV